MYYLPDTIFFGRDIMLPLSILEEIRRYLMDYAWEWRAICKVINLKHGYSFEPENIEKVYRDSLSCIFEGSQKTGRISLYIKNPTLKHASSK